MTVVGVDGCPDGWVAVEYNQKEYQTVSVFDDITGIWDEYGTAELLLVDIPIGLRERSARKRPCDDAARRILGNRSSSVFPTPVREAVYQDSYEAAKTVQEELTSGSLGTQTWAICDKIQQLDRLLTDESRGARGIIREAHPEVCFWALGGKQPTTYSKTGQPAAAFWERVDVLESVDKEILDRIQVGGTNVDGRVSNDDLIDAFVLALTASSLTGPCQRLPDQPATAIEDPVGLPMEMVYAEPA